MEHVQDPFLYKCVIQRIVDGDTVDIDIDLGFGIWLRKERVCVAGIDTPEKRTRDKIEKMFGQVRYCSRLPTHCTRTGTARLDWWYHFCMRPCCTLRVVLDGV